MPATVTIKIARGIESEAVPGEIRLDADLLDAGRFSWGIVQHEYAHQVDFYLLDDAKRATLLPQLGASAWWPGAGTTTAHGDIGGERFASTLAWAFWTSTDNSLRPANARDEAGGMAPTAFREAVARMIAGGTPIVPVVGSPVPAKAPALSKQTKR